jgi:nitronate monooxygenase
MLDPATATAQISEFRRHSEAPINVNFFCHTPAIADAAREARWRERLACYYSELGLDPGAAGAAANRPPFGDAMCDGVEACRPLVVSFHFGLPGEALLRRVKQAGATVLASATTVAEARWLAERGCDGVIAQGYEAGGHRGMFLAQDIVGQPGTMALVPQIVDAVAVPVIAAGGIADGRGIAAAFALGAAGVQIGTAYLFTPESLITSLHRAALGAVSDEQTALTNLFSGRPARSIMNRLMRDLGPMSESAPAFPTAGAALAPLKAQSEAAGSADFSSLWAGQAAALGCECGAAELTRRLAADARQKLEALAAR